MTVTDLLVIGFESADVGLDQLWNWRTCMVDMIVIVSDYDDDYRNGHHKLRYCSSNGGGLIVIELASELPVSRDFHPAGAWNFSMSSPARWLHWVAFGNAMATF
ncbi:hypothetical protein OIU74_022682 [Salix koriyanagi]|uniref:Uncharacterized protein n=1 Tax=Salix koriyanagi TaxID=2511006 RepID=A0A9Q1AFD7_9ROSI|nr:hypothetical protein OIU74_022682 [Salix koriyanagi]